LIKEHQKRVRERFRFLGLLPKSMFLKVYSKEATNTVGILIPLGGAADQFTL
jgi:hypothetical protein